ncbi:MAG: EMC3/TMCO1 family protein [Thermoproteota archaeon]
MVELSVFDAFMRVMQSLLQPYSSIPDSTLFILGIAATLSLITTAANRLMVDVKRIKSVMREVNAWREQLNKARKSNDKQMLARVMKKQQAIMKLQSQVMWDRMKVSFIFLLPFWIIFMVLSRFYGGSPVAFTPFTVPFLLAGRTDSQLGATVVPFYSWYIISSFAVSLPLSRIFGINPED